MDSLEQRLEIQVNDIVITHFVNPHEFWYKYETNTINEKLYDLEIRMKSYFSKERALGTNIHLPYHPKIHEIVAVLNLSDNRWIRAVVDHIYTFRNEIDKYILWAIDYGKPLMAPAKFIRKVPEECANHNIDAVFFGGLNDILPGEKIFDFMIGTSRVTPKNKWSEKSIKTCEEIINRSYTSTFRVEKNRNGQNFGQLEIVTDMNKQLNIKNVLIEINEGIHRSGKFFEILDEYQLNKSPRWLQPNGNCNLFTFNSNNKNMIQRPVEPLQIDLDKSEINLNQSEIEKNEAPNLSEPSLNPPEDEISGIEKIKIWQAKNEQQANAINYNALENDMNEDFESISIGNQQRRYKIKREKEPCIGRMHINNDFKEKLKISRPPEPECNLAGNVPEFILAGNAISKNNVPEPNVSTKPAARDLNNDDIKSIVSIESDKSVKLKMLNEMQKIYSKHLNKKQNDMTKTINIPAGYDLGQLQAKSKHNTTTSSSSSNDLATKHKKNNQILNTSKDTYHSATSSERQIPTNEQQKLPNSQMNYQSSIQTSNVHKYRNSQRMKVDNTLHNVNEVCVPTCSIGKDSVLVHGEIPKPIDKITEAKFTSEIHSQMERLLMSKIFRTQQYAWPHLARLNSLILVNSERTGKTYSYLPMICSLINMQKDDGEIPDGVGPIGIIIIPFRSEAEKLLHQCRRFTKKNVLCTGERNKVTAMGDLQNNSDLLICTPEGINLLLNNNIKCFSQRRIKHLIIENLNLWNEKNCKVLKDVFKKFHSNAQVVVTSQIWDLTMEKLLLSKSLNNPLLCIGAHIEAAIYAKTNFKLKIMKRTFKINAIMDFIKKHDYKNEKIIIVCNNDEDVDEISKNLRNVGLFIQSCTNALQADDIREITRQWNNNSNRENFILITSDACLDELQIQNAQHLIHYTLSKSWTRTCYRFSVFLRYYSDRIKETEINSSQTNTLILLDENNSYHLPKLVNFLERNNAKINSNIKKLSNNIEIEREKQKNNENRPLCEKWLEFDKIHDKNKCDKRHLITYIDAPPKDLPNKGVAEIEIISCESPIHYCVRILKHKFNKDDWQITCQSNKYIKFIFEFANYFSNIDNHQIYSPILFNDLCVVNVNDKYERGRIIEIIKDKPEAYVKLIDRGQISKYKTDKLLYLPEHFKEFPPQAVDLYLTNVSPYDDEEIWERKPTEAIKNWLKQYNNDHRILAYINFSLSNTIYADEIVIEKYLDSLEIYSNKLWIKRNAIEKEFVKKIDNDCSEIKISANELFQKPDEKLNAKSRASSSSSLTSKSEISINKFPLARAIPRRPQSKIAEELSEKSTKNIIVEEKWNMLIENQFSKISIGPFYSPNNFYIKILHEKLNLLYEKIDNFIANGAKSVDNPQIGSNYLAKIDENYNRCKITSLSCDSNGIIATVFFCDHGSNKNYQITELMTTNSEIINILPYQTIHCSLIGISPKNNGIWTDNDCDNIYNLVDDTQSLFARPMTNAIENNNDILKYWKYEIILNKYSNDQDILINEQIIKKGYANKDPDTAHYLDFVYTEEYNSIRNIDEEDWEDDPNSKPYQSVPQLTDSKIGIDDYNDSLNNWEVNLTNEECLEFLNLPRNAKILPPDDDDKPIKEINSLKPIFEENSNIENKKNNSEMKKELKNISKKENKENDQLVKIKDMPKFNSIYKIPQVIWQQSDELICLKISAPDIKDYYLRVKNSSLIFAALIDNEMNVLNLNLFGLIDESLVSHEIRGLNVIVRLFKKITGKRFSWPRLTNETDKHNWLKYNFEAIIMEHENFENSVQPEACIEYESDSDSEYVGNIEYQTYNRIENAEDVYDVLADD